MISATRDCLVVLARRGPQHLVLPPGSCIAITEAAETAQSLDTPEQHSLQHMYASRAAVIRCLPPKGGSLPGGGASPPLPLDWAHLASAAGITHFAALPLYHGSSLAGALTILGTASPPAAAAAASASGLGGAAASSAISSSPAAGSVAATVAANGAAAATSPTAAAATGLPAAAPAGALDSLFRAPLSLELVAMSVAQCCLGADMALATHAVEMVQAMHACASIQQLVAGISLGLQALMHARFCLTLRCSVALAVEFQPNAIMFEETAGGQGLSSAATSALDNAPGPPGTKASHPAYGRPSQGFGSPAVGGVGDSTARREPGRMLSGGLAAEGAGGGGAGQRPGLANTRSGLDTADAPNTWGVSSGHVTASVLLNQIVGRRYKARPFSVYHTLLIRTIHELAASSYGGTVVTQCHDHMQDAKTPSRDIYALGRGVGQPPQCLVLSVTHLRPADELIPTPGAAPAGPAPASAPSPGPCGSSGAGVAGGIARGIFGRRSHTPPPASGAVSSTDAAVHGHTGPLADAPPGSSGGAISGTHAAAAAPVDSPAPTEPRTYIGLYVTSAEPLPAALLELILVEIHSLACHVLSPLVHRKLLVGELAVEWSLMQMVTSSNLPSGAVHGGGTDSASVHGGRVARSSTANNQMPSGQGGVAATPGAAAAALAGGTAKAVGAVDVTAAALAAAGGAQAASHSLSVGSVAAGVLAGGNTGTTADLPVEATVGGAAAANRLANSFGPSAPNSRLSSLQRIMAPFLMADMAPTEAYISNTTGGGGASAVGGGAGAGAVGSGGGGAGGPGGNYRRSSDISAHAAAAVAGGGSTPGAANGGDSSRPGGNAVGIRRILAFDAANQANAIAASGGGSGKGTGTGTQTRASMVMSEGVAREMMVAAAAAASGGGGGDRSGPPEKFLSTEVASVQDTHSQMGLLVTSYKETLHNMHMELSVGAVQRQSLDSFADDPGRLVLREVLGKGGHGVVFRGTMHTLEVAIKVFQTPGEDEPLAAGTANRPEVLAETLLQRRRVLTRAALELAIMSSISHPNIVQVYAQWPTALLERDETQPCRRRLRKLPPDTPPPASGGLVCAVMVMEYCDKGTLVDAINRGDFVTPSRDGTGYKPNYKAIYTTLLEVALALRHLASMAVTHCDVKPANILLRSSPRDPRGFTAKLADFGYAALLRDSSADGHRSVVTDEACGTVTHMAPESFVEGEPVDSSADVYAFGILMWELISGKQPYHDRNLKQLPHEVVNKGLRPTFPPNTPDVYKSLAKSCWGPLPRNRPTAAQVVQSIQAQLDKIEAVARLLGKP
ncbi:hypothetical protein HYH03_004078 [Edaphochlamys debaryana]|uniref:Protein kinase domain-containing protein n=1 Tax=Edaphochlamys debaryana TaxID=47281 RepID=A0A835Y7Q1_9CHLO|nr:hypothetical protein HYH03_004078 [Edaphochlamys debaryana]|eukprot:KAG2497807.1 hypothetical protein HYH03_004078 [Edaphochlamys debaryana]